MKISKQKLFFLGYIALIVAGFLSWYIQGRLVGSRAAGDTVNITFTPTAGTFKIGEQKDTDIIIQTTDGAKKVSGIDLTLQASGSIKLTNITDPVPFPGTDTSLFNQVVKTVADQKIRISYVSLKTDVELPSVIKIRVSYIGTQAGTGKITVTQSQIVGNVAGKQYTLGQTDEGNYVFSGDGQEGAVSMRFDPSSIQLPALSTQDTKVALAITDVPTGKKISGYEVSLRFDPNLIEVTAIDPPIDAATGADADKFTEIRKTINNSTGIINLSYISIRGEADLPVRPKQIIHIKGKNAGTGNFTFENTQVVGPLQQIEYIVNTYPGQYTVTSSITVPPVTVTIPPVTITSPPISATQCSTDNDCATDELCSSNSCMKLPCSVVAAACIRMVPRNHSCVIEYMPDGTSCPNGGVCKTGVCSPNVTTVPTTPVTPVPGNVKLNLKLKFQGILQKPTTTTMKVKVSLGGNSIGENLKSQVVDFTAGDGGVWSGTAAFSVPAGSGYKVYVKGPKHLQKKVCDSNPAETSAGTYRCGDIGKIALKEGDNDLNFSNIILLTGDLPDQDGIVDSYDLSYIRLNLGSTDARVIQIGDINLDGLVDTQDYSLLVASLNVKYDEL